MIELKFDDRKVIVNPELTIEKYQIIQKDINRYTRPSEVLALFLDITVDELNTLPVDSIKFVEGLLNMSLTPAQTDIIFTFRHNGKLYGLENDWGNIRWGQYVDMEVYSQPDKIQDSIHIIMALMYREVKIEKGTKYTLVPFDSKTVLQRAEEFKTLPINFWFGCANFFFLISKEYISLISTYSKVRLTMARLMEPILKILPTWLHPKPLPDITLSLPMNLQTEISQKLNQLKT